MANLGDLERDVMAQLWDAGGPLTVRQVHERLAAGGPRGSARELAYTTVMTVLDRLAKKGVVRQERADRAYRYSAVQTREQMTAALMLDALGAAPDGATRDAALVHFVGQVGPAGAAALRAALDAATSRP
ncbi:MAG: Transcriptional regulator, MecI family [uncultured Quadrisphaera sp.]|uniref:Transcriptional regulator, MecI family n=1 Tax=uncultured Quadrisphaera sp. TaxID=904978 RepID=A0A6J4P6G7_9ACTN|nr:MAG: Transcriptional regulator, MecI family [uncultured Quadrisphaera sp.]